MTKDIKICIIDDDSDFCEILKQKIKNNLKETNINISFNTFNKIEEENRLQGYDLFIVDNKINGISLGSELINKIKKYNSNKHIYASSGYKDYQFMKEILNLNISGFIDKEEMNLDNLVKDCSKIIQKKELIKKFEHQREKIKLISDSYTLNNNEKK